MTVREALRRSMRLLNKRDRRLLALSTLIQMLTSGLDLIGVVLIGLLGSVSVAAIQSQPPPEIVTNALSSIGISGMGSQQLVGLLALAAAVILLSKSVISAYLNRRVFRFLANRQALVTARLVNELMARPLSFVTRWSTQRLAFALLQGAGAATITILGQAVVAATEVALLAVLLGALLLLDPFITLGALVGFGFVAWLLQRVLGGWSARTGIESQEAEIESLNAVQEAVNSYREITVLNRRKQYAERIQRLRWQAASLNADMYFISLVPKYVFEVALVIGGAGLAAFVFASYDATRAVGTLALFLAAASRVMPSLLRLQSAALTMRNAAGVSEATFQLASDLDNPTADEVVSGTVSEGFLAPFPEGVPVVRLREVSAHYPGNVDPTLQDISLALARGESLGIVGPSGAGKSTLLDVILGVLDPSTGSAEIAGLSAREALRTWPGSVAYVPQEISLANGTIRENVALGLPADSVNDGDVWRSLRMSHLDRHLLLEREGLETQVGESGIRLSGGQRQRLGIARALYSRPHLLVLDEATSALDADTESAISETISSLRHTISVIVVAHRLSTVRNADIIIYLEAGRIRATGSFDSVRRQIPDLDRQARLMGL